MLAFLFLQLTGQTVGISKIQYGKNGYVNLAKYFRLLLFRTPAHTCMPRSSAPSTKNAPDEPTGTGN